MTRTGEAISPVRVFFARRGKHHAGRFVSPTSHNQTARTTATVKPMSSAAPIMACRTGDSERRDMGANVTGFLQAFVWLLQSGLGPTAA